MRYFQNPFYLYIITFSLIIFVYSLGWSDLYPELSYSLLFFFGITFVLSIIGGLYLDKHLDISFKPITNKHSIGLCTLAIYITYAIEFLYNGGIPIILIFVDPTYSYIEFGVPTLHPIILTFSSYYTLYLYYLFLSEKKRKTLCYMILLLVIPILIFNRAMLIFILASMLFLYLVKNRKVSLKIKGKILIGILLGLFLFGVAGNYRTVLKNDTSYFMKMMEATPAFSESIIPKEYFWGYIYISSPLATFQYTLSQIENKNSDDFDEFILGSILPDFISKRLASILNVNETSSKYQLNESLNVGTFYEGAARYLGWFGLILLYVYMFFFIVIYLLLIRKSPFFLLGLSILSVMICFNSFTNMFTFSGLCFQLVYPILFSIKLKL